MQVSEEEIISGYDLVIHVIEKESVKEEDNRIEEVWSKQQHYHQIKVAESDQRSNF
jgi:hypothetical protein